MAELPLLPLLDSLEVSMRTDWSDSVPLVTAMRRGTKPVAGGGLKMLVISTRLWPSLAVGKVWVS